MSIGLSGAVAAQRRFETTANNVANLRSTAAPSVAGPATDDQGEALFRPARQVDRSAAGGGVLSTRQLIDPASVRAFEPSAPDADRDGLVNRPNLDIARETVERLTSKRQLEASLATIRTADDLLRATIDIKS